MYKDKNGKVKESPVIWMKYYWNGKPYQESTGQEVWVEAIRCLNDKLGEIAKGKPAGMRFDKVMLAELIEDLKADYKLHNQKHPRTKHLEDFFDSYRVIDVASSEITKYIN